MLLQEDGVVVQVIINEPFLRLVDQIWRTETHSQQGINLVTAVVVFFKGDDVDNVSKGIQKER